MKDLSGNKTIIIGNKLIANHAPTFIIAEAGVNHGGDITKAYALIDLAVEAGADAVKFQTFKADELILKAVQKAPYQLKTTDIGESQFEMLKKLEVSHEQNVELLNYAKKRGIIFLSTPFDEDSLFELASLDVPAFKIASTDLTNLVFLEKVAKLKRPVFLSTGMSYLSEVELALETILQYNKDVVLMQCTANYPIEDHEANLNVINEYKNRFDVVMGYSDHTVGLGAAPYAIPMGAALVEKHFTLSKFDEGPDHRASLKPDELVQFVKEVRKVDRFMGSSIKIPTLSETQTRISLQKYLVAKEDINVGDVFNINNLTSKRTGGLGISAIYEREVYGMSSPKSFKKNDIIYL